MNIEKADYGTIVKFGTLKDLYEKIKLKDDNVSDIINWVDDSGMSILERTLVARTPPPGPPGRNPARWE